MNTEMNRVPTYRAIVLAKRHAAGNDNAVLCLADASILMGKGNIKGAQSRALKSLAYSVGVFHRDYNRALDLVRPLVQA